jgi:hypothetical protein
MRVAYPKRNAVERTPKNRHSSSLTVKLGDNRVWDTGPVTRNPGRSANPDPNPASDTKTLERLVITMPHLQANFTILDYLHTSANGNRSADITRTVYV